MIFIANIYLYLVKGVTHMSDTDQSKEIERLIEVNPNVPAEIFDIEASQEIADLYAEMFGC